MTRTEFAALLASKSIVVPDLDAYLNDLQLGDDIPQGMVNSMVAELQAKTTAIAPSTATTAIAPKRGRKKKEAIAPVATPTVTVNSQSEASGQASAEAIQNRIEQETDLLVAQFDAIHADRQKEAAIHILQGINSLQSDTLNLVARGLEVMPVSSQFRFFSDVDDASASA